MAKRPTKEASTPLIFALVFFVLTTIAFGVMWYMGMADIEAEKGKAKAAEDKVKAAAAVQKEAELNAKLYRIYIGADDGDDKTTFMAEHKAGDKLSTELKRINDAMAKRLGLEDGSKLPAELQVWSVDDKGKIADPDKGVVSVVSKAIIDRDAAIKKETDTSGLYTKAIDDMKKAADEFKKSAAAFSVLVNDLPKTFDTRIQAEIKKFDDRVKKFAESEALSRKELDEKSELIGKLERDKKRLDEKINGLQDQIAINVQALARSQNNTFQYDEAQGKILRRLPDGLMEINLGSDELVTPGLTFTVLPRDYPERGRQSRMFTERTQNERGEYINVKNFRQKANIEVVEVLGPHLSRARLAEAEYENKSKRLEYDSIRDAVAPGDLLYNGVWRKGVADHIALIGIFDVNGDGVDDIESVIRDLTKMGIPVDAYFDMKQRKWVGNLTEQTRYVVEAWYPANSANDPNRDDKTRLLASMSDAMKVARDKGIAVVRHTDFFPRMGYRSRIDLPLDKLNQATAPYLNRVAAVENPMGN